MSCSIPDDAIKADSKDGYTGTIDLTELLSTCIDACRRGCEVIRNVRQQSLQSSDVLDSVQYKIQDDPRSALTEADGASQKVIIECLNRCWEKEIEHGFVKIVGEEEEDNYSTDLEGEKSFDTAFSEDILSHFDNYNAPRPDVEPIKTDMFKGAFEARASSENEDEIIIFIDPMDGTREFVEGRVQNVQCLIGVVLNGLPVAGAVGLPMVHGNRIEIAYGLTSPRKKETEGSAPVVSLISGVELFDARNPLDVKYAKPEMSANDSAEEDDTLVVYSGDSKKKQLKCAMGCLENVLTGEIEGRAIKEGKGEWDESLLHPPMRKIIMGGCGNKMLSLQRHFQSVSGRKKEQDASSSSTPSPPIVGAISIAPAGSSSWDTAAPTAVLLAADPDARVTNLFGNPLVYDGKHLLNDCGVLVSSGFVANKIHERLCEGLCKDAEFCDSIGVEVSAVSKKEQEGAAPVESIEVKSHV